MVGTSITLTFSGKIAAGGFFLNMTSSATQQAEGPDYARLVQVLMRLSRPVDGLGETVLTYDDPTDLYRTGAYPISARRFDLSRNPFYERGLFSFDLRITKGIRVQKGRGVLLIGVDLYNLANHTNALRVSPYYSSRSQPLPSYRGLVEALNARQVQFSLQLEY